MWLLRVPAKLTGKRKVDVFSFATREGPSLVTSGLFSFVMVQMEGAHWLADAVRPFGIYTSVFGTDWLKSMP